MIQPKIFFCITGLSFVLFIVWLLFGATKAPIVNENVIKEAIQNLNSQSKFKDSIQNVAAKWKFNMMPQATTRPEDLKYMLIWNERNLSPLNKDCFRDGQESFILKNCPNKNCYVTTDRKIFGGDITKFEAIAFNGRNVEMILNDFPKERSSHQKYIYFNMESAENFPVCNPAFDNFFNWTATYRLDSDVQLPYILIRKDGEMVGPNVEMDWLSEFPDNSEYLSKFNKTKAAAWFVSHCSTRSKREDIVSKLREALSEYGYNIDIYGSCGPFKCPRNNEEVCHKKLETDYYFYLSLENSHSEDYVTEKLLTALLHDVVPIVYGGADYSRFLPPKSYIDAREYNASSLASLMDELIRTPSLYAQYFRWKQVYQYWSPQTTENVCRLCAALNSEEMFRKNTVYTDFRKWWLGLDSFEKRC